MFRMITGLCVSLCVLFGCATPAGAADFPNGTFTIRSAEGANWELTFHPKGQFTLKREGREAVSGTYSVDSDEVVISDERGPAARNGTEKDGTYKWKVDGKKLTLKKVKDANRSRELLLTEGPMQMKAE
jgi:hypothetical protein